MKNAFFVAPIAFALATGLFFPEELEDFGQKALAHIQVLASSDFQGRKTGTAGGVKAEKYVAEKFKEYGLSPWKGSYFQEFTFPLYSLLPGCSLELLGGAEGSFPFAYNEDFYFFPGSGNIDVTAEVVFVGYGLHAPEHGYDDFARIDVKGKIVLAMEGLPTPEPEKFEARAAQPRSKAQAAQQLGAVALVLVDDPTIISAFPPYKVWGFSRDGYFPSFALAKAHYTVLNKVLQGTQQFAGDIKKRIDRTGQPASFPTGKRLHLRCRSSLDERARGANVLGLIPGADPVLKDELVSIGAHIDGGGLDPDGAIFFGAEDNASGTAVLLEIAERLRRENFSPLRTILFAGWAAEEQGAFGSQYFIENPIFPLNTNAFNFCLDNVGWGDGEFWLFSANNFPEEFSIARAGIADQLLANFIPRGLGGSDSYFFQQKGIPVLFAHATQSQPYNHTPLDVPQFINTRALKNVSQFMSEGLKNIANYKGRLINPDRAALFTHRLAKVVDAGEALVSLEKVDEERNQEHALSQYMNLRSNGIDAISQEIPASRFKESILVISRLKDAIRRIHPAISLLESPSELRDIEEGARFLVALKLVGVDSFDRDLACLQVLRDQGVRLLRLDLNSNKSLDYRAVVERDSELTEFGLSLLRKSDELGLVLELKVPGSGILERILGSKENPVLIDLAGAETDAVKGIAGSVHRRKVYLEVPVPANVPDFGSVLGDDWKILADLGLLEVCVLNPSAYSASGVFKNFTAALMRRGLPENLVKGILGENFIRLFAANARKPKES